ERMRDYQDRLRILDARGRERAMATATPELPPAIQYEEPTSGAATVDPLEAERRRREYESLFASNVVSSRRPEGRRLVGDDAAGIRRSQQPGGMPDALERPSLDDVAAAVLRATAAETSGSPAEQRSALERPNDGRGSIEAGMTRRTRATAPIGASGPTHRLLEGTVIDTVLMNRLDGSATGPVNCLVTNAVYSHSGQHVLVPAGTRVIGETKPVQSLGETRLAVVFHRLVLPDGRTYPLDDVAGLNQVGDAGLRDQVDHHRWSTIGGAGAVGLVSGLAQWLGTAALGRGDGDRTIVIAGGMGNAASQATAQTMGRYLNRLPTVTIREGHRVKVYLMSDLELPAYESPTTLPIKPVRRVGEQLAQGMLP
ncbi:MAG: TrbI/VirB10 family protein, partial [Vicinamibacterales bacterium]